MLANEVVDGKKTLGVLGWVMLTGVGTLQMQPVLGGALVERWGLSLQQMGMLFGIELLAMAIGCFGAALKVNKLDRRIVCQFGLVLLAAGSALSASEPAFGVLCLSRAIAGAGGGMAQSVVYATSALRRNKDQTYASINILLLLWGALTIAAAPLLVDAAGVGAVFLSFPIMALMALPLTRCIPRHAPRAAPHAGTAAGTPLTLKPVLLMVLFGLLFGGHGVLWIYQERIGNSIGLSGPAIGAILGMSILAGALGAAAAGLLGRRLSHLSAQMIGFTGSILASLGVVYGQTPAAFACAACAVMAVWFFGLTYLFALSAEIDPSGRLTSLANAAIFVGQGAGPVAAAVIVGAGDFRAVGWLSASIYLACLGLAAYVTAGIARGGAGGPSQAIQERA